MKLDHLELSTLSVSSVNVRKHGTEDVTGLAASIRSLGVLQPLLVRAAAEGFEVVAGQRRLLACQLLAADGVEQPIPCAIMEEGDDAAAIEASLAENIERLPMDEIDQYTAFAALVAAGRLPEDIASHFGVTERLVKQRLALANLDKRILGLFREGEIGGDTMRALTLATKSQQKAWLKKFRDPQDYAPHGYQLRKWLLGGEEISTSVALFPIDTYKGAIVSDLFGENAYFSDPATFWILQKEAIGQKAAEYMEAGWHEVVTLDVVSHWPEYEYRKTPKKRGGKVFICIARNGEVAIHEGYTSAKEERQREAKAAKLEAGSTVPAEKPELTKAAHNYLDLHRHAAVQMGLVASPLTALRVTCAHMIAGSSLWTLRADPRRADRAETTDSVTASISYQQFELERKCVLALLGYETDEPVLVEQSWSGRSIEDVFPRVMNLTDEGVLRVIAFAMAETLQASSPVIDAIGADIGIDMASVWEADEPFLDLVVSKATLASMLLDVGGTVAADAHKASTSKVIRRVIAQFIKGEERPKVDGWLPPQMAFPQSSYAQREHSVKEDRAAA